MDELRGQVNELYNLHLKKVLDGLMNILENLTNKMAKKEPKKEYNKSQCVYGPDSKAICTFCSHICKERYDDFKECGINIVFI